MMALVAVLLVASGCAGGVRVGKLQTESRTVELGGAESVRVDIEMGAGVLDIGGELGDIQHALHHSDAARAVISEASTFYAVLERNGLRRTFLREGRVAGCPVCQSVMHPCPWGPSAEEAQTSLGLIVCQQEDVGR